MSELDVEKENAELDTAESEKEGISTELEQARKLLAEYKKQKQEIRDARKVIFKAKINSVIGPILSRIESEYEKIASRIAAAKEVGKESKGISEDVKEQADTDREKTEDFAEKQSDRTPDGAKFLDRKIAAERRRSNARTFFGSISARIAKMPYTMAARFEALRGNDEKAAEFIERAAELSDEKMLEVARNNREKQMGVQKKVTAHRNMEKRSEAQAESIDRAADAMDSRTEKWGEKHTGKTAERTVRIDRFTTRAGKWIAGAGQVSLTKLAELMSRLGADKTAESLSKSAGSFSHSVMQSASKMNTRRHKKAERRIAQDSRVDKKAESIERKMDAASEKEGEKAEQWVENGKEGKPILRLSKGLGDAVMATTKFFNRGRVNLYEFAAHVAAKHGRHEQSQQLMKKAEERSMAAMGRAKKTSESIRSGADKVVSSRTFKGFKKFGQGLVALPKTIASGIGELGSGIAEGFQSTIDKVELRYQQIKLSNLEKMRSRRAAALERIESGIRGTEMAAQKTQERISEREGGSKEEAPKGDSEGR